MNHRRNGVLSSEWLKVRVCRQEDLPEVFGVETRCFRDPYPDQLLRNLYYRSGDLFLVAEEGGKIVGYVVAEVQQKEATVVSIAVLESHRNNGVASTLMNSILARIVEGGCMMLSLQVSVENKAAVSLYTKLGFKKVSVLERYYADGSDALLMSREAGSSKEPKLMETSET